MEISITEEQNHLLNVAINSAIKPLLDTGNVLPTVLTHDMSQVRHFSFSIASLDSIRRLAAETIDDKSPDAVAYAFLYDSTIQKNGKDVDALIIETADWEDSHATEFAVIYNRSEQSFEEKCFIGNVDSLFTAMDNKN